MMTMPSSPMEAPMFPPAPVSMYTEPETFSALISTLLKSRWANRDVAAKRRAARYILRMAADYRRMQIPPALLATIAESHAKVRVGYPWWLRPFLMRDVIAITLG